MTDMKKKKKEQQQQQAIKLPKGYILSPQLDR
jgi:hypothetical protein